MSTRCQVHFVNNRATARVYHHYDGYPGAMLPELNRFFEFCQQRSGWDDRFDDVEYLAARYIYWLTTVEDTSWNGLGVGVAEDLHGDEEYLYTVRCSGILHVEVEEL